MRRNLLVALVALNLLLAVALAVGLTSANGGSNPGLVYGHLRTSPISMPTNMLCGSGVWLLSNGG